MTSVPVRPRRRIARLTLVGLLVTLAVVANLPVTTRQGVDFHVTAYRMPLYLKAFEFIDRDAHYRRLAREITRGAGSDQERALAVFSWTARRIQPTPAGWPVVDDHILNIIIRGHGVDDQRADVFATLATYAGVPAFWQKVRAPGTHHEVIMTFVQVDGRWVVMDVARGFVFRTARGALATVEDLTAARAALPAAAESVMIGATPYRTVVTQMRMPQIPRPLRAELQMPWPRLWHQTRHAVGVGRNDGFER